MKKAVFISYNQALTERVAFILDQLQIRGFTQWPLVNGAGTVGWKNLEWELTQAGDELCHLDYRGGRNGSSDLEIRQEPR